ncbi:MAG: cupin domain-containing protein [Erythrobacter sp.]|nr:cupin domain-containing protein [Erythrobacter sp.]
MSQNDTAAALVEQLGLSPHPEGGWYRETWRGPARADGRAGGTAIHFLLKAGERSHWHTVDAEEMWLWQGGDPLTLRLAASEAGPIEDTVLGSDVAAGEALQGLVPTGHWQAAEALPPDQGVHGYSLVSCVVVPGFDFAGFRLAEPGWGPGAETSA